MSIERTKMKVKDIVKILEKHDKKHKTNSVAEFMALIRASKAFSDMFYVHGSDKGSKLKKFKVAYTEREIINNAGNLSDILVELDAWNKDIES